MLHRSIDPLTLLASRPLIVQCSKKGSPTWPRSPLSPSSTTGFKLPELKLPKFDLDALFAVQKANLATTHEAQTVLVDAVQAIAKVQQGRIEQAVADAKAVLEGKKLSDAPGRAGRGQGSR